MKQLKQIFFLALFLLLGYNLAAQISYGGEPASFKHENLSKNIDKLHIKSPDLQLLQKEDKANDEKGRLPRVGVALDVDINMENAGSWDILDDGRHIWRLQIASPGAQALGMAYDAFDLPRGSQLFIYSSDKLQRIGAFNDKTNSDAGDFTTEMIYGESFIMEYISPRPRQIDNMEKKEFENTAVIDIRQLEYFYRHAEDPYRQKGFGDSQSCEVNINCSEGNSWQDEKRGVARMKITDGSYIYWCTGSLVNNSNQDGTPYFLSAYHCGEDISTSHYSQWLFYFNYEFSGCNNTAIEPASNSISGCSHLAEGSLDGGSDFLLVELNSTPPASYSVLYNGWTTSSSASSSGVGIHHPMGDVKKISTYTSPLSSATYGGSGAAGAHWRVYWSGTENGHGVTEGGSSGSPIFNSDGRIVGTLSGGTSSCDNTSGYDLFGKFSYHWDDNGSSNTSKLQPWLDPSGSLSELGFYDPNNSGVTAAFTASTQSITEGGTVSFSSVSTGPVEDLNWTFEGGDPETSNAENPVITYNTAGTFDVTLTVSGGGDSDTHSETNYIIVEPSEPGEDCDFLNDPLTGTPTLYTANGDTDFVSGTNSYGDLSKANIFYYTGTGYVTKLGFHAGYASGSSSSIQIAVWNEVGGSPANMLGSKTIPMSEISDNFDVEGDYFEYSFNSPIEINGDFFAGIVLPGGTDMFALITNTDGDVTNGTAWEEWDDNSWYPYSDVSSWEVSIDHAIYPEVCTSVSSEMNQMTGIQIFPNPTQGKITLQSERKLSNARITVYNSQGIRLQDISRTQLRDISIDLSQYSEGLYLIDIRSTEGQFRHKIQLKK